MPAESPSAAARAASTRTPLFPIAFCCQPLARPFSECVCPGCISAPSTLAHPLTCRVWDARSSEAFVAEHFPRMLDFYHRNLTDTVMKSDVMRLMLMYQLGGM